jgi:hypothetical protein
MQRPHPWRGYGRNLDTSSAVSNVVSYLEPGRKRRRRGISVTSGLWLIAGALILALVVQAALR